MKSTPLKQMVPKRCIFSLAESKQTLSFPIIRWRHVGCQLVQTCRLSSNKFYFYKNIRDEIDREYP